MARASSGSSSSSSSSSSNGNSNSSKKSTKSVDKFSSKYVGTILTNLIDKKKETIKKNPKNTAKWLAKMQISIQKKVSNASMLAFQANSKDANPEAIKADIARIQAAMEKQVANIRDKAKTFSKKSELKTLKEGTSTYKSGKYEDRVLRISDQFGEIARQLDAVAKDMQGRIHVTAQSLSTVESTWVPPPINQKPSASQKAKVSSSSSSSSSSSANSTLKSLASHLKAT